VRKRESDGRFAAKEPKGKPFEKGHAKLGGRKKGVPNKTTRAVKEFLAEILDRADVQDAIRQRILKGDTAAFFKAVEHVLGKPKQSVGVAQTGPITFCYAGEKTGNDK